MNYLPDYGERQLQNGVSPNADQIFYEFRLYNIARLGSGNYSTMVHMPLDGVMHSMSLDFGQQHLDQILRKAVPQLSAFIKSELSIDPETPRMINFEGFVTFGVRARLGNVQSNGKERFVPLVAQEILEEV